MNDIKNLTKQYLSTLGISAESQEKLAEFNANSEWVIFSASSLEETDVESVYGLHNGQSYRGVVRADEQGFLLVDLAEYPPSLHTESLKKQRLQGIRILDTAFA